MNRIFLILFLIILSKPIFSQDSLLLKNSWITKQLSIENPSESNNQFELLIFLGRSFTNAGHVIHIYNENEKWVGIKYHYYLKCNKSGCTKKIKRVKKAKLNPTNGWGFFVNKLEQFQIYNLPSQIDIDDKLKKETFSKRGKGYLKIQVVDGSSYDIIVKNKQSKNSFSFHSPWIYLSKFPEVQELDNYNKIISLIEKDFDIKFR